MPNRRKFFDVILPGASVRSRYRQARRPLGEPAPLAAEDLLVRTVG
jgi:hypothetical protein